jgi:ubiquinone/menaquinone biosynthesis C-methylase UbiE
MGLLQARTDRFTNSTFSNKYLVEGEPEYVGDLLKLQFQEWDHWRKLSEIFQKNRKMEKQKVSSHEIFIRGMDNLGKLGEAEALTGKVDLSNCRQMADVGGGSGVYSLSLCEKYPDLNVTLLDKLETLDVTRRFLAKSPLKSRITLRECDIEREDYGKNLDVVLLSDVIYDVNLISNILKRVFDSLRKGGQLIIRGYYSDPAGIDTLFSQLFVLQLLAFDPAREILTMPILVSAIEKSGFRLDYRDRLTERSQLIIARKT